MSETSRAIFAKFPYAPNAVKRVSSI